MNWLPGHELSDLWLVERLRDRSGHGSWAAPATLTEASDSTYLITLGVDAAGKIPPVVDCHGRSQKKCLGTRS